MSTDVRREQQVFAPAPPRPTRRPTGLPSPPDFAPPPDVVPSLGTRLLKALFFGEAVVLVATTALGISLGVTHPKRARTFRLLIVAGTLLPVVLARF